MQIDSCYKCMRKHLGQATVCYLEARKGHPEKVDMVMGHLAEAEDACPKKHEAVILFIREARLGYEEGKEVDFNYLFEQLDIIFEEEGINYGPHIQGQGTPSTRSVP